MGELDLCLNLIYDWGGQTDKHTDKQTHTHINTMTRPGLGAGQSEKKNWLQKRLDTPKKCWFPSKKEFFWTAKKINRSPHKFFFSSWQWWYYLHRPRDSVSPLCRIFNLSCLFFFLNVYFSFIATVQWKFILFTFHIFGDPPENFCYKQPRRSKWIKSAIICC